MENFTTTIKTFILARRDMWAHWVMIPLLVFFAIVSGSAYLTVTHPAAAEILTNMLIQIGLFINYALAASALLVFLAFMAHIPGKDITITFYPSVELGVGGEVKELPEYSIGSDDLIVLRPSESNEDFFARTEAAAKKSTPAHWVVSIPYRSPLVTIFGTLATTYNRDDKIFELEIWPNYDGRIAKEGTFFTNETPEQYEQYIARFCQMYREWAPRKKPEFAGKSGGPILEILRNSANVILLFLLFSVSAFGQKSAKVAATKIGNDVPPSGVHVSYIFAQADIYRTGNGSDNYAELLKKVPGYRDSGGGELLAVMSGNKSVYKASQTGEVAERPATKAAAMRPYSEAVAPEYLEGQEFQMPDSLRMAEMAEKVKFEIYKGTEYAGQMAAPWWEVVMYAFWRWSAGIALLMGICWFWASLGSDEGYWGVHRHAKNILMLVTGGVATLFAINIYLWFVAQNTPTWALYIVAAIEFGIAYAIVRKVNPDFRPAKGNNPIKSRNQNNDYPELPTGR